MSRKTSIQHPMLQEDGRGLVWVVREGTDDHLVGDGHEAAIWPIFDSLPPWSSFLDVGAHVGHYAVRMAAKPCKVYAVEPNPSSFTALSANIVLNRLDDSRFRLYTFAADDHDGFAWLEDPNGLHSGGSTRVVHVKRRGQRHIECAPIDKKIRFTALDLVKIDVEGGEVAVLRGMKATLRTHKPRIVLEMHEPMLPGSGIADGCRRVFDELGYDYEVILEHADVCEYWLAYPSDQEGRL